MNNVKKFNFSLHNNNGVAQVLQKQNFQNFNVKRGCSGQNQISSILVTKLAFLGEKKRIDDIYNTPNEIGYCVKEEQMHKFE